MSILNSLSQIYEQIGTAAVASLSDDYQYVFSLYPKLSCCAVHSSDAFKRRNCLLHSQLYIYGGGGVFPSDEWKQYLKVLLKAACRKLHGGRNIIHGVDLCRLDRRLSRILWRGIGQLTDVIIVRNQYSADLLHKAGVKNVHAYPDITFSLETAAEAESVNDRGASNAAIQKLNIGTRPYIVIVLAKPWSDEETGNEPYRSRYELLCKQMENLCNKCIKDGLVPIFLPFFHENDRDFISRIEPNLCGEYKVCEEYELALDEKRLLFAGAKACISMRFHGVAFSLFCGTPCEAICYAPKTTELMKDAGLSEYCVEFGIRSNSCFFREFDIDGELLMDIYEKVVRSDCMMRFRKASEYLREKGRDGERKLLDTILNRK